MQNISPIIKVQHSFIAILDSSVLHFLSIMKLVSHSRYLHISTVTEKM